MNNDIDSSEREEAMDREIKEREVVIKEWKKFRRYKDGAEYYGISQSVFERLAKDADAIYKIGKISLVNCEIFEKYLEFFKNNP